MQSNSPAVCSLACSKRASVRASSLQSFIVCAAVTILVFCPTAFGQDAKKPVVSKSDILKTPKNTLPEPKKSQIIRAPKGEPTPVKTVETPGAKKEPVAPILSEPGSQGGPKPSVEPLTVDILTKPREKKEDAGRTIITAPKGVEKNSESESEIIKKPSS